MIVNDSKKPGLNSREKLAMNDDGSVTLRFGPTRSAKDTNWIQTNPEKGFFVYMRFYAPTKAFFNRSWKMGNLMRIN